MRLLGLSLDLLLSPLPLTLQIKGSEVPEVLQFAPGEGVEGLGSTLRTLLYVQDPLFSRHPLSLASSLSSPPSPGLCVNRVRGSSPQRLDSLPSNKHPARVKAAPGFL